MSAFIGRPHGGSVSEESACKAVDAKDVCSVPGSGRSPGGGNGNPLQHSCLENPLDRGAWRAAVHGVRTYRLHHQHQGMPGCQDHLVKRMPSPGTLPGWGTLTRPPAHPQSPGDLSGEELKAGHRSLVSRRQARHRAQRYLVKQIKGKRQDVAVPAPTAGQNSGALCVV